MREFIGYNTFTFPVGPFVSNSDGLTPVTGLTLSGADEKAIRKYGDVTPVSISANSWAAVESMDGHYNLTLTNSQCDTLGPLRITIQDDSACLPFYADIMLVTSQYWNAKYSTAPFATADAVSSLDIRVSSLDVRVSSIGAQVNSGYNRFDTFPTSETLNAHIITLPTSEGLRTEIAALPTSEGLHAEILTLPNSQTLNAHIITLPTSSRVNDWVVTLPTSGMVADLPNSATLQGHIVTLPTSEALNVHILTLPTSEGLRGEIATLPTSQTLNAHMLTLANSESLFSGIGSLGVQITSLEIGRAHV